MNIVWKGSPNYDTNRKPIDRIVIHWFGAGTLESAHQTFQKIGGTSAHYGVSDTNIWQWVKETNVAYHAGNYAMNQRSIGIEHDANPNKSLSEQSYLTSAKLLADICKRYAIPLDRTHIIKHSEVKATQCPGTIDLDKLINLAKKGGSMDYEKLYNEARIARDRWWNGVTKLIKSILPKDKIEEKNIEQLVDKSIETIKSERKMLNDSASYAGSLENDLQKSQLKVANLQAEKENLQERLAREMELLGESTVENKALQEQVEKLKKQIKQLEKQISQQGNANGDEPVTGSLIMRLLKELKEWIRSI